MSSGLFLPEKPLEQNEDFMKIETLKKRLNKNRQMTEITLNIPSDVVDDLKRVATKLGFTD